MNDEDTLGLKRRPEFRDLRGGDERQTPELHHTKLRHVEKDLEAKCKLEEEKDP